MHDLRTLRDQINTIRDHLGPRGSDVAWDDLGKLLQQRGALIQQVEDLRHQLKKKCHHFLRDKKQGWGTANESLNF